jgi:cell division septation protein DedD
VANHQKTAPVTPVPAPAAVQKKETSPVREKFLVQLVSYQQKSKADELAGRLKSLGYAPRIEVTNLPDKGKWFRVIMDGFQSREDAQKAADKLSRNVKGLNCVVRSAESPGHP